MFQARGGLGGRCSPEPRLREVSSRLLRFWLSPTSRPLDSVASQTSFRTAGRALCSWRQDRTDDLGSFSGLSGPRLHSGPFSTGPWAGPSAQMSYSLNSLNGGYVRDYMGTTTGVIKGDTRSSDYSSNDGGVQVPNTLV